LTGWLARRASLPGRVLIPAAMSAAVGTGLALTWAAARAGPDRPGAAVGVVAVLAVLLAAANGFAKAYSP
jgi:hypothetical protein